MGRKRAGRSNDEAPPADGGPSEGEWQTDTGTVRLERDPYSPDAWTVYVNGVPSSHVDLEHPQRLDFEYMRWMAAVVQERWPKPARLRALHLGGGACSMARWIHWAHPDARQVVVELDAKLTVLVREWFRLPTAPLLRLRAGDAGVVLPELTEHTRDLIIRDVFAGDTTPAALTTAEYHAQAKRVLDEGGLYLLNVGDRPDRSNLRAEALALRSVFAHVAAVADPAMLKGRRRGNVVLLASDAPLPLGAGLTRRLLGDALPASVWDTAELDRFLR